MVGAHDELASRRMINLEQRAGSTTTERPARPGIDVAHAQTPLWLLPFALRSARALRSALAASSPSGSPALSRHGDRSGSSALRQS